MATKEELFAAVRTIRNHCKEQDTINPNSCVRNDYKCPLWILCFKNGEKTPSQWPDPEEGGGKTDKKTNCSDCGNQHTPVCKYCEHDAEGGTDDG